MFQKFLNSLKTPKNASLIETIQKAYLTCLESEIEPEPNKNTWKTSALRQLSGIVVAVTADMQTKMDASLLYLHHMKHALKIKPNTDHDEILKTLSSGMIE
jgi:hypothetical protein